MPELPEVEVVKMSLEPRLLGERFRSVSVHAPALREPLDRPALTALQGAKVEALRRRSKYLLVDLDVEKTLAVHLGMSGRFTVVEPSEPRAKHEHLAFGLGDGSRLRLVDPRRFGQALVLPTRGIESDRHFAHLGPEPLGADFSGAVLAHKAEGRRGPIKTFLMDARVVVGVGNIYASEALFRAGVSPKRSVARVSRATWDRVAEAVRETLAQAIHEGGTTLNDFTDGEGNAGYFQVSLAVYGREGEACGRCDDRVRRLVQANRSSYYCSGCQR
ncbi:MAG: bifunctional DNA-formamidopyrimidine glycosylase/DNA-(apurinic or apyrimidinic site) lyase [Acidobacteriota bacterium]